MENQTNHGDDAPAKSPARNDDGDPGPNSPKDTGLAPLRKGIDQVDDQILALLNRRYQLAIEVGKWKAGKSAAIFVPEREKTLISRLEAQNPGPLPGKALRAIYREIISGAISLERPLVISCPGGERSPAHQAALGRFGANANYSPGKSLEEVFQDVGSEVADYGVVPIEHSAFGPYNETLDRFIHANVKICAEIKTSASDPERTIRFLVLGKQEPNPTGDDKTSILISARNRVGALCDIFHPFKKHQVNISMWGNRPSRNRPWEYFFYLAFHGHVQDQGVAAALEELKPICLDFRLLGSYPAAGPPV